MATIEILDIGLLHPRHDAAASIEAEALAAGLDKVARLHFKRNAPEPIGHGPGERGRGLIGPDLAPIPD
jgi:hypothetical protein